MALIVSNMFLDFMLETQLTFQPTLVDDQHRVTVGYSCDRGKNKLRGCSNKKELDDHHFFLK